MATQRNCSGYLDSTGVTKYLLLLGVLAGLSGTGFLWNESRKEIVYLCGNFVEGTPKNSVLRQLSTGIWLTFRVVEIPGGSHLTAKSTYNLNMYTCSIDFNADELVVAAEVI